MEEAAEGGGRPQRLSDDDVVRFLEELHVWVAAQMGGLRAQEGWMVSPGSPLAGDDRATAPHQTSHTAHGALGVALDHLHALTFMVAEHKTLHLNATYTLARGAIENAAITYWLVAPPTRRERVLRTLRLHAMDVRDATNATDDLGATALVTLDERMEQLRALAAAAGIDSTSPNWPKRVTSVEMVKALDEGLNIGIKPGPLGAWRLFSGMAHGRPWASAAFMNREVTPVDGLVSKVRRANTPDRVLFAASIAQDVITLAMNKYEERA
ncbi:hypothetical protein LRP67_05650 [Nocardioides sp. cx-169]|uniref:hypothetical protein n=1 Tax=Nocardioides sp. cx-169 TaxID=2899080 RepID=UPI001E46A4E2|nr:hypothetical protein [Nocardioides sp. cx-169]MCD4533560.1 hypothetical protein [Nocardioides sp. cx-169]